MTQAKAEQASMRVEYKVDIFNSLAAKQRT